MNRTSSINLSTNNATSSTDTGASACVKGGLSVALDAWIGGTLAVSTMRTISPAYQLNSNSLTLSATDGYYMIQVNYSGGGTATVTLPLANTCPGKQYFIIKLTNSSNPLTIQVSGSDKIDGVDTSITTLANPYDRTRLTSDGISRWFSG